MAAWDRRATAPVIILNWNGWNDTLECLRALGADESVDAVWLVDNGSISDRSKDAFEIMPQLRYFRWERNYGFAGGYNRALRVAAEEAIPFVYLLNNDAIPQVEFLSGPWRWRWQTLDWPPLVAG